MEVFKKRFFEVDTAKNKLLAVEVFLSHKKMAVEKMKSHFGSGICPDRSKLYMSITLKMF